jgi:hypothetical protein
MVSLCHIYAKKAHQDLALQTNLDAFSAFLLKALPSSTEYSGKVSCKLLCIQVHIYFLMYLTPHSNS